MNLSPSYSVSNHFDSLPQQKKANFKLPKSILKLDKQMLLRQWAWSGRSSAKSTVRFQPHNHKRILLKNSWDHKHRSPALPKFYHLSTLFPNRKFRALLRLKLHLISLRESKTLPRFLLPNRESRSLPRFKPPPLFPHKESRKLPSLKFPLLPHRESRTLPRFKLWLFQTSTLSNTLAHTARLLTTLERFTICLTARISPMTSSAWTVTW